MQVNVYGGIRIAELFKTAKKVETPESTDFEAYNYGDELFLPCSINDVELPNEPVISLKGKKRIIKTPVPGLPGTVKEHIQLDDYQITIKGIAVNDDEDDLPQEQIRELREMAETLAPLKITNRLLSYFNIDEIVITSFDFPGVEGHQNMQAYVFQCLSNQTIDLVKIAEE
jgi:hypothetical protein